MKNKLVLITSMLIWLGMVCACSSDDDDVNPLLFNEWVLVSYGNESNEVLKEANGYYYSISFHSDGTYSGLAYGNRMDGKYKGNDYEIKFYDGFITAVLYEGSDPDNFFLEHWRDVNSYTITENKLRLYYSKDHYFMFRKHNN